MSDNLIGYKGNHWLGTPLFWSGKLHPIDKEYFMAKNNTNDNFEKYKDHLKKIGHLNSPNHNPTMGELAAEGECLLQEEEKCNKAVSAAQLKSPTTPKAELEEKLGSMSSNPYIKARIDVLNKMSTFNRREIETMEKEGNTDNRFYAEFVHNVRLLADSKYPS